jgi:hypothetical protein
MAKDSKEMLKTLLSNQHLIMQHLGIEVKMPEKTKKTNKAPEKKTTVKSEETVKSKAKKPSK